MVMGLVSTIALALAFGPQLQVNLQAVAEDVIADSPRVEDTQPDLAAEILPIETPRVVQLAELQENDLPAEEMEETALTPSPIATPAPDLEVDEAQTQVDASEAETPAIETTRPGEVPSEDWPSILAKASTALADAKTARGAFIQTNSDGSVVTGSFALNRPGRMRFDYDDPTPVLIVSDGTTVAMQDSELETVDRVPIGSTPLGLILSTQLNVEDDVDVLSVMENPERIGIRVSDASGELEGTLTMVFDKQDYTLLGWQSVDGNYSITTVDLLDVETNIRIDPRLFRLNEDDDEDDER